MLDQIKRNIIFVVSITALTLPIIFVSATVFFALPLILSYVWATLIWLATTLVLIAVWMVLMARTDVFGRLVRMVQQSDANSSSS
jgi:hypothetical protein